MILEIRTHTYRPHSQYFRNFLDYYPKQIGGKYAGYFGLEWENVGRNAGSMLPPTAHCQLVGRQVAGKNNDWDDSGRRGGVGHL